MSTIISFDPGYDRLGWATAEHVQGSKLKVREYGCVETQKTKTIFPRYEQIIDEVDKLIKKFEPDQAAIESLFFFSNQKTAMKVAEARGVVIACLLRKQVRIFEYTPLQIKQAVTGYGRADKKAVEKMVRSELLLSSKEKILDDTIDALALQITHQVLLSTQHLR